MIEVEIHWIIWTHRSYILKVDFLDFQNPQKIQIFRRKIVLERENYQFCNVLEKKLSHRCHSTHRHTQPLFYLVK